MSNQQEPKSVVISTEVYKAMLAYLGQQKFNDVANLYNELISKTVAYIEPEVTSDPVQESKPSKKAKIAKEVK